MGQIWEIGQAGQKEEVSGYGRTGRTRRGGERLWGDRQDEEGGLEAMCGQARQDEKVRGYARAGRMRRGGERLCEGRQDEERR